MSDFSRRDVCKGGAAAALTLAVPTIVQAQEATLKVIWMGWPEDQVKPLMDEFEKRNPRIKLAVERIPFNQIFQTLEVRLNARTSDPDIFICDSPLTASYAARGHLMELDSIIDKQRFSQSALAAGSYEGKLYSAPFGSSMQVLYYNRALFRDSGIEPPPSDPQKRWTWEQVRDAAQRIAKPTENIWGFAFEQSERPYQLLPLGQSLGGKALSDDGFKATGFIDAPPFVEGYTFMQKLYTDWKVSPQGQFDPNIPPELFGTGKLGMLLAGTFTMGTLASKYANLDYGVAPHPYFAKGKPVTPTGAWHIGGNPRTSQKDVVAQFIREMMSDEMQILWFGLRPYPPVLNAVWDKKRDVFSSDAWKIARNDLETTAVPRPATPGFREYEDVLRVALRDIQTGADVSRTLTAAAQRIDREIAKYKG
jgi:fructooligosaccharide transport system substrate-binding protein